MSKKRNSPPTRIRGSGPYVVQAEGGGEKIVTRCKTIRQAREIAEMARLFGYLVHVNF